MISMMGFIKLCVLLVCLCTQVYSAVQVWQSTIDKTILLAQQASITPKSGQGSATTLVTVNSAKYQEIYGFGGALTEASAMNLLSIKQKSTSKYSTVLNNLFSTTSGAGLSVLRVPIGSTDFSELPYFTYDDTYDDELFSKWSWQRDSTYVLPVLKDILAINPNIKVLLSPWSGPNWMKTSANYSNAFTWGEIKPAYYDDYAYYLQFTIQKFQAQGISIYALTIQNEPTNEPNSYPVMRMSETDQIQVATLLGQKLAAAKITTKILIWDDNWNGYQFPIDVLSNAGANAYIAGSAFHCYNGNVTSQTTAYNAFPNKEIWFTECSGYGASNFAGNIPWATINLYMGAVQNWARTVLHFNLALNTNYGPKASGGCTDCRGIITLGSDNSTITYNEEYYGLAMFSKFLKYPAYRLACTLTGGYNCVYSTCFLNADATHVIVVGNFCGSSQAVVVQGTASSYISVTAPIGLTTFIW